MVVYNKDAFPVPCEPGVSRKVLCYSDNLMMCEITFEKGSEGNAHKHPHEQITYIVKGKFDFTVGDETKTVSAGDSVYMPANTMHGVKCLEAGVLADIFSPKRDDFLEKLKEYQK